VAEQSLNHACIDAALQQVRGEGVAQHAEVSSQDLQQTGGEHGVAIFAAFAVFHPQQHTPAVDVAVLHRNGFGNAQSGAVADQQHGAVLDAGDVVEKALDFLGGQHHRQFLIQAGARKIFGFPRHLQGGPVEKLDGGNKAVDALRGKVAVLPEIKLILAHRLQVQILRAAVEVFGEVGDIMDIAPLRGGRKVAKAHVFDHALM
jgi:hypothetical protein